VFFLIIIHTVVPSHADSILCSKTSVILYST